jgi:site-specific DNA recombinase
VAIKTALRVIAYIRGSTEEQQNTIEAQRASIDRYCQSLGLEVAEFIIDSGVSGSIPFMERPGAKDLLDAMKRTGANSIAFTKLDRAFRSVLDCITTMHRWNSQGIGFHIIEQRIDTASAMGRAMLQIIAVIAELENGQRAERQRAAFGVMRDAGQRCGTVPYGWQPVTSMERKSKTGRQAENLVPLEFEQGVLRLIVSMHSQGQTDNAIARFLNGKEITAKRGGKWHGATVQSVREHARIAAK